jgi:ketohexokinase
MDVVNVMEHFPAEDADLAVQQQHVRRGGNAANTLGVLSQLGSQAQFCGSVGDDSAAAFVIKDMETDGICTRFRRVKQGKSQPNSCIITNAENGSRTILHFNNLTELTFADFVALAIPLQSLDWIHFQGRNIREVRQMMQFVRRWHASPTGSLASDRLKISVEVEKVRRGA